MSSSKHPFEAPPEIVLSQPEPFIDAVFDSLQSFFLVLPRGPGFVAYPEFADAYEILKRHTHGFGDIVSSLVVHAIREDALAFVVLRAMLGLSPPELAYVTAERTRVDVSQSFARRIDRRVREDRQYLRSCTSLTCERIEAMIEAACQLINSGAADTGQDAIHRLDKVDTRLGKESVEHVATHGVPYAVLLYERFLGRPFASHRDAVSGVIGNIMEDTVEAELRKHGVSFRRTQHADSVEGFDQAPDFIITDEWNPRVVIEAKSAEDDGTARDKVTRIQHLATISTGREAKGLKPFQVVACIDGRGFGVRREDMRKLLEATRGKVFTLQTLQYLVQCTDLAQYAPQGS